MRAQHPSGNEVRAILSGRRGSYAEAETSHAGEQFPELARRPDIADSIAAAALHAGILPEFDRPDNGHSVDWLGSPAGIRPTTRPSLAIAAVAAHTRKMPNLGDTDKATVARVRRRNLLLGVGASLLPTAARAQQKAMQVIGILRVNPPENPTDFVKGLAEAGYVEGRNVVIEQRSADGQYARLPALAAELVQRRVTVIYAVANVAAHAAKAATSTIPIVFSTGDDPVAIGLVSSLARPGGNLTGVSFIAGALPIKRLELLHEMVPAVEGITMLVNPNNANAGSDPPQVQVAASALKVHLSIALAASDTEIETAFVKLDEQGAKGLLVNPDAFLTGRHGRIVALAARYKIPTIYAFRSAVEAGGLMSYGGSSPEVGRQAGLYVGRILAGAKPADLPVVQSTKTELVINLKTAKALGLTVPKSLLARADEVIE
jgi:putative ABC transport system substrate-binding protein